MLNKDFFDSILTRDTTVVTAVENTPEMPEEIRTQRLEIAASEIVALLDVVTSEEERECLARYIGRTDRQATVKTDVTAENQVDCETRWKYIHGGEVVIHYVGNETSLPHISLTIERVYHSGTIRLETQITKGQLGSASLLLYPNESNNQTVLLFHLNKMQVVGKYLMGTDKQRAKIEIGETFGNIDFNKMRVNSEYVVRCYEKFRNDLFGLI